MLKQPIAPIKPVTDNYFGIKVIDPYRYMETFDSEAVQQWVKEQADYTNHVLAQLPERDSFLNRMLEIDASLPANIDSVKQLGSGGIFYLKQGKEDDVWKLYMRKQLHSDEVLLLDPAEFQTEPNKPYAINQFMPSWDGKYITCCVSVSGSEAMTLYVIDTQSHQKIDQPISRIPYGWCGYWLTGNQSFFYSRRQEMTEGMATTEKYENIKVSLHALGTDIAEDKVVLEYGASSLLRSPAQTPCVISMPSLNNYMLAIITEGTQRDFGLYIAPIATLNKREPHLTIPWEKICDEKDKVRSAQIHSNDIYLITCKNAPRFKIVRTSVANPNTASAKTILEPSDTIIKEIQSKEDALYVILMDSGVDKVIRIPYGGEAEQLQLPFSGSINFAWQDSRKERVLLQVTSWIKAEGLYEFNPATHQFSEIVLQPKGEYDEPGDLIAEELEVRSHEGTLVPLSIVYKKGLRLDGSNPCWLTVYGAYGSTYLCPHYRHHYYAWYERGGIAAFAHVRGGGEKGEAWYRSGFQQTKPNTWKDFIACAEYLIENQYTSPSKLSGEGGSAGGITIGRAITERPDLFAAACARVGNLNPLRMETTPNGKNNIPEFGSCETEAGFRALYEMDAYLHVEDGVHYPAVLVTHGINDPRVEPWLSTKFAARLQAASASGKPTLLRIDYTAGHGAGSTKTQAFQERADIFAFMIWQAGVADCKICSISP